MVSYTTEYLAGLVVQLTTSLDCKRHTCTRACEIVQAAARLVACVSARVGRNVGVRV